MRKLAAATLLIVALVVPLAGNAQQYVSNRDAKVDIWLPEDWVLSVWNISSESLANAHVMDRESGRQVVVELRSCEEDERESWARGEKSGFLVGSHADSIEPADERTAELMPDAASYVTAMARDSLNYRARVFFSVEGGRCYLTQFISVDDDFEPSLETFTSIADDMRFDPE